MPDHLDFDELAEISLAPTDAPVLTPYQRTHLRLCACCRGELDELRELIRAARGITREDLLVEPPATVWRSVAARVRLDEGAGLPASPSGPVGDEPPTSPGTAASARSRRTTLLPIAVALAVGMLLGGAAAHGYLDDDPVPATAGARRTLVAVHPARPVGGSVRVEEDAKSGRHVSFQVTGLPSTAGYYEVWLMDPTRRKLIAMGVLGADGTATLPVPHAVDLAEYPLFDISEEHDDGDPAHSGKSVLSGGLPR
ncbi:anti-sigma factor [Streptomyces sp. NPDC004111]|uniref:anti-sigma factor n=1 Tax=Streptomyces sp. NPDC004111 TaxID=3364690 RepID=UPI0036D0EB9D